MNIKIQRLGTMLLVIGIVAGLATIVPAKSIYADEFSIAEIDISDFGCVGVNNCNDIDNTSVFSPIDCPATVNQFQEVNQSNSADFGINNTQNNENTQVGIALTECIPSII